MSCTTSVACSATSSGERLNLLFERLRPALFSKLYRMLGNYDDAQDALQFAFLRCWKARHSIDEVGNLQAWIWRVSLNAGRDLCDRLRYRRGMSLTEAHSIRHSERQANPVDQAIHEEEQARLNSALVRLRPEEREVFLLRRAGELTYEQIARRRGGSVGAGKTLMHRALHKLRRALQEQN